jgi:hypothetical protein
MLKSHLSKYLLELGEEIYQIEIRNIKLSFLVDNSVD